jgi:hypothetical protein
VTKSVPAGELAFALGHQRGEAINQTSNFPNILISNQIANKPRKRVRLQESGYDRRM